MLEQKNIAVLLPCYNEAAAIAGVIENFKAALPNATIYVYDNCSTDDTAIIAREAGATVRHEAHPGKGNVVRRMFADIDADVYVLADGDMTYDAAAAPTLISALVDQHLDMVVGTRAEDQSQNTYRSGHRFGNLLFNKVVHWLFGRTFSDILSGYRVFSRRFVKSMPVLSGGFDIEVEMTIHSLELRLPVAEMPTKYFARPEGSESKLNSYRDGIKILWRIVLMLKETKPLLFFGLIALLLALIAGGLSTPLIITYLHTGLVPRLPTAVLVTGIMLLAFLSLTCGMILDSVGRSRREKKLMHYLRES